MAYKIKEQLEIKVEKISIKKSNESDRSFIEIEISNPNDIKVYSAEILSSLREGGIDSKIMGYLPLPGVAIQFSVKSVNHQRADIAKLLEIKKENSMKDGVEVTIHCLAYTGTSSKAACYDISGPIIKIELLDLESGEKGMEVIVLGDGALEDFAVESKSSD